jgi:hypothetical protein
LIELKPFPSNGWGLDVYQAAPSDIGAIISGGVSTGALAALYKLLPLLQANHLALIISIGLVTFLFSNLLGLKQENIKRLLGYSSIAQLGLLGWSKRSRSRLLCKEVHAKRCVQNRFYSRLQREKSRRRVDVAGRFLNFKRSNVVSARKVPRSRDDRLDRTKSLPAVTKYEGASPSAPWHAQPMRSSSTMTGVVRPDESFLSFPHPSPARTGLMEPTRNKAPRSPAVIRVLRRKVIVETSEIVFSNGSLAAS